MQKPLEWYLNNDLDRDVSTHTLTARRDAAGKVTFYIHPANVSGDTCEYVVSGNMLLLSGQEAPAGVVLSGVGVQESVPFVNDTAVHQAVMLIDSASALVERTLGTNNSALLKSSEDVAAQLLVLAKTRLGGK